MKSLTAIRIFFLLLCTLGGYAISQLEFELFTPLASAPKTRALVGMVIGFGFGGLLVAVDEMLKGFSLRAFSSATFGLVLGTLVALMLDRSGLLEGAEESTRRLIRIMLFLGFGYIGMVLAMRSNKEDFSLIIPYVRFASQNRPENRLLLDTSVIIDGRIAELIQAGFLEGVLIVPRFVLLELQKIADSNDPIKRARGRRGLEILNRLQRDQEVEVKIHEGDFPEETTVDSKLLRLAQGLGAILYTTDYNLGKVAEVQGIRHINVSTLANALKPVILPGETISIRLIREGRDKGQGVGYLADGTMVVVNNGQPWIGQQIEVQVQSLLQTGAGVLVFATATGSPTRGPEREEPQSAPTSSIS